MPESNRQGLEYQSGTGAGFQAIDENNGENRHTGQQGNQCIQQSDGDTGAGNGGTLRQVGTVDHDGAHAQAQGKEGVAHGDQYTVRRNLAEIRGKQELQPLVEGAAGQRVTVQHDQQHKQRRHQETYRFFKPAAHAARDHNHGHHHEQGMPGQQAFRITGQLLENTRNAFSGGAGKGPCRGPEYIGQRPAGNDTVIGKNQESSQHAGPAEPPPARMGAGFFGQAAHGIDGTLAAAPAQHDFRHHDRNTDDGDTGQVHQHKGPATIFPGNIGKLPDIAQTHRRTGRRQHKGQAAGPAAVYGFSSFGHGVLFRIAL